jgi:hypothetical protein
MSHRPEAIGPDNFELWTARILLDPGSDVALDAAAVQNVVTDYVTKSGITIVGYHTIEPLALTLLRWPDTRPGYSTPTIQERDRALDALAGLLGSQNKQKDIVSQGKIHVMMGRKMDGYGDGDTVPIEEFQSNLPGYSVTEGHMISARTIINPDGTRGVETYGEPVGIIVADRIHEALVHEKGDTAKQFHYAMERGPIGNTPGRTDFYETRWARAARTESSQPHELISDGAQALRVDEATGGDEARNAFADRLKKLGFYE